MARLFTFGCSFTRYYWPTWAEMLGRHYDTFENWGNSGIGNRAIGERLIECIVHKNITKDDTVIIQWTEFHRFDFHLPMPLLPEGWSQGGNMLTSTSVPSEILTFWNERSFIMHSLNYINLAVRLLESIGCKWYMTSIRNLDQDASEFFEFIKYREVFRHNNFLPPISEFLKDYDFPSKELYDHRNKKMIVDDHPTPVAHHAWLAEILAPKLGITIDSRWCDQAHDILMKYCHDMAEVDSVFLSKIGWSRVNSWVRGVVS